MMGNTHFIGGVAAGVLAGTVANTPVGYLVLGGLIGGVGGLIPDLDSSNSTICKICGPIGSILSRFFKHRGILHTPIIWLVINVLIGVLFKEIYHTSLLFQVCLSSLFWGEISHVVLDSFNYVGTKCLYPFSKKHYHIIGCKADGIGNSIAWVICFLITTMTLASYFTS